MKQLKNLNNSKILSKEMQKSINGGKMTNSCSNVTNGAPCGFRSCCWDGSCIQTNTRCR